VQIVHGHDDTILTWLQRVYGVVWRNFPAYVFGVIDRDGVLRGCVILEQRNEGAGELHVYGSVSPDVSKTTFMLAFRRLEWRRLECRVLRRNKSIRRAALKWGWRFECICPDYFGAGVDAAQYSMTPGTCRWLKEDTHGKVAQSSNAA
jgi:RimJ/RimL family protein N-acetyltransferase